MYSGGKSNKIPSLSGFTIVELLVVIVVIGILASITIISYTRVNQRAVEALLQSDLNNFAKLIKMDQVINSAYPTTLSSVNNGLNLPNSLDTTYQYVVINHTNPQSFCVAATKDQQSYKITNDSSPVLGDCIDYGLTTPTVVRLDSAIAMSYPGSGTSWTDLSDNGNNGALMNGVGYNSNNWGSLTFDGTDDYVDVGNAANLDALTDAITVEAWVNPDAFVSSYQRIVAKQYASDGTTGNSCFQLGINSSNKWRWSVGGVFDISLNSPAPLANSWYHIVGTYNRTLAKIYINGTEVYSAAYINPIRTNSSQVLTIGTTDFDGSKSYYFKGLISSVSIYNRALSGSEVQQNFNAIRDRYGI
ncbi:MAG: LamG domain-containing protein [Candidatus Saccharimonadales bacterium]